eukprot:10471902-Lingulodinium_polyedra.AAC.1
MGTRAVAAEDPWPTEPGQRGTAAYRTGDVGNKQLNDLRLGVGRASLGRGSRFYARARIALRCTPCNTQNGDFVALRLGADRAPKISGLQNKIHKTMTSHKRSFAGG